MCGRYASARGASDLAAHFDAEPAPDPEGADPEALDAEDPADPESRQRASTAGPQAADREAPERSGAGALPGYRPSWNVAPTDPVPAVLERAGRRRLTVLRWGLVPSWARDAKGAARLINARRETVADKPAFRAAYARRRCLLPADGYYEWQRVDGGKQPWFLSDPDGDPLAMAGLYEVWRGPDGSRRWTCTVLTTDAADEHGRIHDRTPLLVERPDWARWLDPERTDPGQDLLVPGAAGRLRAWPVGRAVGDVRADGPELARPADGDGDGDGVGAGGDAAVRDVGADTLF